MRATDQGGLWFEKSLVVSILDLNETPAQPVNLSPGDGAQDQPVDVTLQASPFSDLDSGDSQAASQWVVRRTADNSVVFDSGEDAINQASRSVPAGLLGFAESYNWQTRYKDSHGLWGPYSAATTFSTSLPAVSVTLLGSELVLSWPTNAQDFSLEYATNFPSDFWLPVSPPPSPVGDSYFVTNTIEGDPLFFRLNRTVSP